MDSLNLGVAIAEAVVALCFIWAIRRKSHQGLFRRSKVEPPALAEPPPLNVQAPAETPERSVSESLAILEAPKLNFNRALLAAANEPDRERRLELSRSARACFDEVMSLAVAEDLEITDAPQLSLRLDELLDSATDPVARATEGTSQLVAIVDTETTGLAEHDEPISIAVILVEVELSKGHVLREVGTFHGLREPKVRIDPRAQAVHGMTAEQLAGKRLDVRALCELLNAADVLVAHNAKFDRRMLAKVLPYTTSCEWACSIHSLSHEWAKLTEGERSLDAICSRLGVPRQEPHDAMADARALLSVLKLHAGKTARSSTLFGRLLGSAWAPPP